MNENGTTCNVGGIPHPFAVGQDIPIAARLADQHGDVVRCLRRLHEGRRDCGVDAQRDQEGGVPSDGGWIGL